MRMLVIDPWGVKSIAHYLNGFCEGVSRHAEVDLITNYHYKKKEGSLFFAYNWFFRLSEIMSIGNIRLIIRGVEYILTYLRIFYHLRKKQYDIIHIEWLLFYKLDLLFVRKLKKHCLVIYKAHNVVPHEKGEIFVPILSKIYDAVDYIVLHGESIKSEFLQIFPSVEQKKIIIQPHGTYADKTINYDLSNVDESIVSIYKKYDRISLFFGGMFYNKGVDRLVKIWSDPLFANSLLVIAGQVHKGYHELLELYDQIERYPNILFLNEYVDENTLNFLITNSHIVLLPYRHASMSGVLFTAAKFSKPVLCTAVGSLPEYVNANVDSYVCLNDDMSILEKLKYIQSISNTELKEVGILFNKNIERRYSWNAIGKELVLCYKSILLNSSCG